GPNKSVLEFGCSTGYMSRVLKANGCKVVGVEIDPDAAKQAAEVCDRVIVSDAERGNWAEQLKNDRFEVIVFGDVLEHLADPLSVLRSVRPLISEDGYVVASIPNIAHGSVRLALLSGEFVYRKLGLLDDTHVRFFTRETIAELFAKAGFIIEDLQRSTAGIFNVEVQPRQEFYSAELISQLQAEEDALTYQYICKAVPAEHEAVVEEVYGQLRETQRELKSARINVASLREEQQRERKEHAAALASNDDAIKGLQAVITVKDSTIR